MNYQLLFKRAATLFTTFAITTTSFFAQQTKSSNTQTSAEVKQPAKAAAGPAMDHTVLPIPEPNYPHSTVLDARDAKPPPRFEIKAPAGAPNVLVVLVDDIGFGMPSAFGGPVLLLLARPP
jgi:hypothetical protein